MQWLTEFYTWLTGLNQIKNRRVPSHTSTSEPSFAQDCEQLSIRTYVLLVKMQLSIRQPSLDGCYSTSHGFSSHMLSKANKAQKQSTVNYEILNMKHQAQGWPMEILSHKTKTIRGSSSLHTKNMNYLSRGVPAICFWCQVQSALFHRHSPSASFFSVTNSHHRYCFKREFAPGLHLMCCESANNILFL